MNHARLACALAALSACGPRPGPEAMSTGGPSTTTEAPPGTTLAGEPTTTGSSGAGSTVASTDDASSAGGSSTGGSASATSDATSDATTGEPIEPWECPLGWPDTSEVVGTTPLGPFAGRFAGFGESGGECGGSLYIQVVEEQPQSIEDLSQAPSLFIELSSWEWDMQPFLGAGPAHYAVKTGMWGDVHAQAIGEVTITEFDPYELPADPADWPRIVGDFALAADGWELAGHFEADVCGNLFAICP